MQNKSKTESFLRLVNLPNFPHPYSVIPHGFIIDKVRELAAKFNLTISTELYKAIANGEEARGLIMFEDINEPDIQSMLTWTNSYNKKVKFGCTVGGYILENQKPFVFHNAESQWIRKHTGTAFNEVEENIYNILSEIHLHFKLVIKEKKILENISLTPDNLSHLAGRMFFIDNVISPEIASSFKKLIEKEKPATAWDMFKVFTESCFELDPKKWHETLSKIHYTILNQYNSLNIIAEESVEILDCQNNEVIIDEQPVFTSEDEKEVSEEITLEEEVSIEVEEVVQPSVLQDQKRIYISALDKKGKLIRTDDDGKLVVILDGETFERSFNKFMVKELSEETTPEYDPLFIENEIRKRYSRVPEYNVKSIGTNAYEVTLKETQETFIVQ